MTPPQRSLASLVTQLADLPPTGTHLLDMRPQQAPHLRSTLLIRGQALVNVSSPLLPSWAATFTWDGVHPATVAHARQGQRTVAGTVRALIEGGYLSLERFTQLMEQRVASTVLALGSLPDVLTERFDAPPTPSQADLAVDLPRVTQDVLEIERARSARAQVLTPTDRFQAFGPSPFAPDDDQVAALVYGAVQTTMALGEVSARLPLRWDLLTGHVADQVARRHLSWADGPRTVARRVQAGEFAPDFTLTDMQGQRVSLSDFRGRRVWLLFNRQATCALCNPHHAAVIEMSRMAALADVQIVSVWGSDPQALRAGVGRMNPPYPVLSDPVDETYDRYGLHFSLAGTLDHRNLRTLVQGFRMMGPAALKSDGELTRMPAEFLIDERGVVEHAHYNTFGADWLSADTLLSWAERPAR